MNSKKINWNPLRVVKEGGRSIAEEKNIDYFPQGGNKGGLTDIFIQAMTAFGN